jgi:hypothetical protein
MPVRRGDASAGRSRSIAEPAREHTPPSDRLAPRGGAFRRHRRCREPLTQGMGRCAEGGRSAGKNRAPYRYRDSTASSIVPGAFQPQSPGRRFGRRALTRIIHKPQARRRRLGPNRLRWRLRSPLNVATATLSGLACRHLDLRADTVPGLRVVPSAVQTAISGSRCISLC